MMKKSKWAGPKTRKAADLAGIKLPPRPEVNGFREPMGFAKGARVKRHG